MTSRLLPVLFLLAQALPLVAVRQTGTQQAPPEGFAHPAISRIWQRDDGPVASGRAGGAWMWGPGPFRTNYEPFAGLPQGNHLVQYFDKGRLEINDPSGDPRSDWFATSGLLVKEMVSGKVELGAGRSQDLSPARIPVAGDTQDPNSPTYAHFTRLLGRTSSRQGQDLPGNSYLITNGTSAEVVGGLDPPSRVTIARYEEASGHNWANVFWDFANSPTRPARSNWLYTLGYPISEPYWIRVPVNGKPQFVLVQLFERRMLTFNPANPPATQVEMGNVGRHYYDWRYADLREAALATGYNVYMQVGPTPRRVTSVQQSIKFTNTTGGTLSNAVLRAVWKRWDGVFTLKSATINGAPARIRWLLGINLELTTASLVPPGGQINIALSFDVRPRQVGGRTGYDKNNDILGLGDMLPTLVPWENGGWLYYPYSDLGDLGYYAASDYSVEIASTGSERLVVGGTGEAPVVDTNGARWRFNAAGVRDVGYIVAPRFINPLGDPGMTQQVGDVRMLAYFLPEHMADGQRQLQLTAPALAWFSREIGPYQFKSYTIAEMGVPTERTDNYAQEYPLSYFIPASWLRLGTAPGTWTWYTPVHEVAHQWFYSTVGNNQLTDPWLDEALATYITAEYVRSNFPTLYAASWQSMTKAGANARPVSSSIFSGFVSENQYSATIYDNGALMLDMVRRAMGEPDFYAALRDYYKTYQGKRATTANLQSKFQEHTKADLKPIFSKYLGY